jgi:hypothetical protein
MTMKEKQEQATTTEQKDEYDLIWDPYNNDDDWITNKIIINFVFAKTAYWISLMITIKSN